MKKLACWTCGYHIGSVDLDKLESPVTPEMFESPMPERGVPKPFSPGLPWHQLHCRVCKHRAFAYPDRIRLIDYTGKKIEYVIGQEPEDEKLYTCECGKSYQHQQSLIRHKKDCTWKK